MSIKLFPAGTFEEHKSEYKDYLEAYFPEAKLGKKIRLLTDVVYCYVRYGSWFNNYFEYRFWDKSGKKRNTFLTWKRARRFINVVNGEKHCPTFRKKHEFLQEFSENVHREWIFIPDVSYEDFLLFVKKHSVLIEKNDEGMFGIGVAKKIRETIDNRQYYDYGVQNNILLEEYINECEQLQNVHPDSLNTIRVMTLVNALGTDVKIVGAVYRMGNNGASVDNARSDGLFAEVDIQTGIVKTEGVDFKGNHYVCHPYSNQKIIGIEIPLWEQVIEVCKKAAMKMPNVRLVGWDVVVRERSNAFFVELIEGNDRPGVPTIQVPSQKGIYFEVKDYD